MIITKDVASYKIITHCGGCILNRKDMLSRLTIELLKSECR
jgi:hypothetical protein